MSGSLVLQLDGEEIKLKPGDVITILPEQRHSFVSPDGAIVEEISSTHFQKDSYYTDTSIMDNRRRKSIVKWVVNNG